MSLGIWTAPNSRCRRCMPSSGSRKNCTSAMPPPAWASPSPPLSQQIRRLEEKVGYALSEREPGRVTLTPAAGQFLGDQHVAGDADGGVAELPGTARPKMPSLLLHLLDQGLRIGVGVLQLSNDRLDLFVHELVHRADAEVCVTHGSACLPVEVGPTVSDVGLPDSEGSLRPQDLDLDRAVAEFGKGWFGVLADGRDGILARDQACQVGRRKQCGDLRASGNRHVPP